MKLNSGSMYRPKRNTPIFNLQHADRHIDLQRFLARKIHWSSKPSYMRDVGLALGALPALVRLVFLLKSLDARIAECVVAGPYSE